MFIPPNCLIGVSTNNTLTNISSYTVAGGQEEATLYIVKCLKENRKLVFQTRNKACSTTMSRTKLKQQENIWIYIQEISSLVRKNHLLVSS